MYESYCEQIDRRLWDMALASPTPIDTQWWPYGGKYERTSEAPPTIYLPLAASHSLHTYLPLATRVHSEKYSASSKYSNYIEITMGGEWDASAVEGDANR